MKLIIDIPDYKLNDIQNGSIACSQILKAVKNGKPYEERPKDEWIPIKTREMTEEEKEEYPDYTFMYDCHLPDDGEEVLVTTFSGMVTLDTFYRDDGCYFECYCDDGDVVAWQPKPESYKKEVEENGNNSN